jgi:hypothetical protein
MSLLRAGLTGLVVGAKAAKKAISKIKQPKLNPKKARDLGNKGMIGSKIKKSTTTIKGINPRTKSRIGKGDIKVENLSKIVDVKLPKEPAILRTNYLKKLRGKRKT